MIRRQLGATAMSAFGGVIIMTAAHNFAALHIVQFFLLLCMGLTLVEGAGAIRWKK